MTIRIWPAAVAGAAALAAGSAACAQDAYSWTGFYVGGHVGADWRGGDIDGFDEPIMQMTNALIPGRGIVVVPGTSVPFAGADVNDNGWTWGGQAGFAYQSGAWVLGAEGDVSSGDDAGAASVTASVPATILETTRAVSVSRAVETKWDWSARARLGYAWDRYQIYATGGLAGAKVEVSGLDVYANPGGVAPGAPPTVTGTAFTNTTAGSVEDDRTGWTLGGGGEWAVSDRISIGVEYRHTDLGSETYTLPTNLVGTPATGGFTTPAGASVASNIFPQAGLAPTTVHHRNDTLTLRVNLRFGM